MSTFTRGFTTRIGENRRASKLGISLTGSRCGA